MLSGTYLQLYQKLIQSIDSKRIFHDPLHTLAFGTDASFYRLIPKMVVKAKNEDEVSLILKESSKLSIPETFRVVGKSLSGQAISDSVLVIAGNHWRKFRIENDGLKTCSHYGAQFSFHLGSFNYITLFHLMKYFKRVA